MAELVATVISASLAVAATAALLAAQAPPPSTPRADSQEVKQRIELMAITEIVLRELNTQLEKGFSHDLPVPYFHVVHGRRVRDLSEVLAALDDDGLVYGSATREGAEVVHRAIVANRCRCNGRAHRGGGSPSSRAAHGRADRPCCSCISRTCGASGIGGSPACEQK